MVRTITRQSPANGLNGPVPRLTRHAERRMYARGLRHSLLALVLRYGRRVHVRGALIRAVGRREVTRQRGRGVDLSACEGLQVVCAGDGRIITVYRNRDFRGLRHRR